MHISRRTFHETVFHFYLVLHRHFTVVSSGQKLQHRKKAMSNHHCASEMIVS